MDRLTSTLNSWAPTVLSLLRIVVGLLFLQHGLVKLLGFPMAPPSAPSLFSLIWFAGALEIVGGILLILGLFTRPVAFIVAGEMAFAYFIGHHPRSFFPIQNAGNLAILYCFVFFYLTFAGPGPISLDAQRSRNA
ncbi:DoxX family protein [Phreatobacter stygius]|uniref:DoxX family protein n=1 Tax=Phreatobacter stygius TaxID=1940610 RepID=A0A4D7AVV6_9HYPH|nr:DoxX family protein [Phreatobacter stygius]QCI63123.1 DoxX family protein [Phreatobacter stygius]